MDNVSASIKFNVGSQENPVYGYSPRPGENGNWFAYDTLGGWYDTGIPCIGEQGGHYTPSVDADGNLTWNPSRSDMPVIDGGNIKGPPGPAGQDGAPGSPGPAGPSGADGHAGADGFSPTIAVEDIDGGHKVTVTDVNGTRSFDVLNGKDGQGGGGGTVSDDHIREVISSVGYALDSDLHKVAKSGKYSDLTGTPSIPTKSTVTGWGFAQTSDIPPAVTDNHINDLIDAKLEPVATSLSALADRAEEVSA